MQQFELPLLLKLEQLLLRYQHQQYQQVLQLELHQMLLLWHLYSWSTEYNLTTTAADGSVETRRIRIFPTPFDTFPALVELASDGRLVRYAMASLFRVLTGFALAALIGIPLGLWAGWQKRVYLAINPLVQGLRPISPLAWIPIAVLSFGIQDEAAIFIIFLGAFFPIVTGTMTAVQSIPLVYVRSAQNFGVSNKHCKRAQATNGYGSVHAANVGSEMSYQRRGITKHHLLISCNQRAAEK